MKKNNNKFEIKKNNTKLEKKFNIFILIFGLLTNFIEIKKN
jgi:hypothetical protein